MATTAELGRDAYRAGRYEEAARLLEAAIADHSEDTALRLMLARSLEQAGRLEQARKQFRIVASQSTRPEHQALASQALATLEPGIQDLEARLLGSGKVTPEALAQASVQRHSDETLLGSWLRTTGLTFSDLVRARFGSGPTQAAERPFKERVGMRLVDRQLLTQFQLKQALMDHVLTQRPLGAIVIEKFGLQPAVVETVARQLKSFAPKLPETDGLGPTLIRWGVVTEDQWRGVLAAGRPPAETLISRNLCDAEHLTRVATFQREKLKLLHARHFRLGEVLVDQGVLSREQLAKMVACQVDQPFTLGEVLLMQRTCTPEAILEGLATQKRRYTEAAEQNLPPLRPVMPPEPMPQDLAEPEAPGRRRRLAIAVALAGFLGYAVWYGFHVSGGNYEWLNAFKRFPGSRAVVTHAPNGGLRGGSDQRGGNDSPSSAFDTLGMPNQHAQLDSIQASMDAQTDRAAEPFAMDGPPNTPNGQVAMEGMSGSPEPDGSQFFDRKGPQGEGVAYPMESQTAGDGETYGMQGRTETRSERGHMQSAQGDVPPQPAMGGGRPGGPRFSYGMSHSEGGRTFTAPAHVPPPPGNRQGQDGGLNPADLNGHSIDRSSSLFRYRLGQAYYSQGQWASAQEEFKNSLRADPSNPLPLYFLGRLSDQGGDNKTARRYLEQYLKRTPNGEFAGDARQRLTHLGN